MAHPLNIAAAGIIGSVLGWVVGCLGTCSFNMLVLGCKFGAKKQPDPVEGTADFIWCGGMILGAAIGAILAILYVRKPRNPS